MKIVLCIISVFFIGSLMAQDVVPKAKTKEQRKAERKKMTLEQKIEDIAPVDVTLPNAKVRLPGNNTIKNLEDAKKVKGKIVKSGKKGKDYVSDGEVFEDIDKQIEKLSDSFEKTEQSTKKSLDEARKYVSETIPDYGKQLKEKSKKVAKDLKKQQTKLFDGKNYKQIAVEKRVRKRGSGKSLHYIEFYVLKEHQAPLPYRRVNTWYDEKNKRFSEVLSRDTKTNSLLHGPYREYRGESLVKEGYYYLGVKDGRWLEYDKDFVLLNKENYVKGFYADSKISYFDGDSTKIQEVIPVKYDKITGDYYKFFKDGTLAEEGVYDLGKKIKVWVEYYEGGNRRKRVTQHPNNFDDLAEPFVLIEYDENRKVTFEHKKTE
jgi:antitoxin component YwqK of YwqJK toxin-antitoxin module